MHKFNPEREARINVIARRLLVFKPKFAAGILREWARNHRAHGWRETASMYKQAAQRIESGRVA